MINKKSALRIVALCICVILAIASWWGYAGAQQDNTLPVITLACAGDECVDGTSYPFVKHSDGLYPDTIPTNVNMQKGWTCTANCDQTIPRITGIGYPPHELGILTTGAELHGVIADRDHTAVLRPSDPRTLFLSYCDGVPIISFDDVPDTFTFVYVVEANAPHCIEGTESAFGRFQAFVPQEPTATATPVNTVTPTVTPTATQTPSPAITVVNTVTVVTKVPTATPTATATPQTPTVATQVPTATATTATQVPTNLDEGAEPCLCTFYLPIAISEDNVEAAGRLWSGR